MNLFICLIFVEIFIFFFFFIFDKRRNGITSIVPRSIPQAQGPRGEVYTYMYTWICSLNAAYGVEIQYRTRLAPVGLCSSGIIDNDFKRKLYIGKGE